MTMIQAMMIRLDDSDDGSLSLELSGEHSTVNENIKKIQVIFIVV